MSSNPIKIGIVGLGRWAKVLTRAAMKSDKFEIVCGYSRSVEKRQVYEEQFGIATASSMEELLSNPEIKGMILTVPNEQHLPVAEQVAKAGKHVYTEKPSISINTRSVSRCPGARRPDTIARRRASRTCFRSGAACRLIIKGWWSFGGFIN